MQVHGSCHCGQVTFTSEAKPEHTVVCHCRDCQVMSGGPYPQHRVVERIGFCLT